MKILSKYKDYYDYLTGIYGEDPKIILDRRLFTNVDPISPCKVIFYICGKKIEGFFDGTKYNYGESLHKFGNIKETERMPSWMLRYLDKEGISKTHVEINIHEYERDVLGIRTYVFGRSITTINCEVIDDDLGLNKKMDCPILKAETYGNGLHKFPPLINYNLGSILPPEEIYQMLVKWYSDKNNELENRPDNRTDVEKLISKGFDKKESFRPKIKS